MGGSPSSPRLGTGCEQGVLYPPWGSWLCGGRWEPSGNRRYHLGHAWGWGSPGRLGGTAWDTGPSAYLLGDIGQFTSGLWASISTSACDVAAVTLPARRAVGGLVRTRMGRASEKWRWGRSLEPHGAGAHWSAADGSAERGRTGDGAGAGGTPRRGHPQSAGSGRLLGAGGGGGSLESQDPRGAQNEGRGLAGVGGRGPGCTQGRGKATEPPEEQGRPRRVR